MVLFEEDEVEALKGEKIKTLEDLKKVKNPKTKKKIAGKIVAAIALALGIPIIKVATMLSKDPEGTGELFKSNTIVELAKQASKENKEALTKAGEKGLSGVGDYVKNFLKGKGNDAVSGIGDLSLKKWEDDKFASGIGKAFGKVASRILRAFRFVADGDGSANSALYGSERMGGMLEDVNMLYEEVNEMLEEEISKKVTKKLEKLEKLIVKFNKQSTQAVNKLTEYLKTKQGKEIPEFKRKKVIKTAFQLRKAKESLNNIKQLKKFNDKVNSNKDKEYIKKIEKETLEIIKETKRQVKDSMDDSIIKTILRDAGVLAIFVGLPSILSAIIAGGIPVIGPIGALVGTYDIGVAHHNREIRRARALSTSREIKYENLKEDYFPY